MMWPPTPHNIWDNAYKRTMSKGGPDGFGSNDNKKVVVEDKCPGTGELRASSIMILCSI